MKHALRRLAATAAAALSLAVLPFGPARAAPDPVENYTRPPAIDDVAISPSGKRLAVLVFGPEGRRRLGVMNLDPLGAPKIVAEYTDADVETVHWINDERLVYTASEREAVVSQGKAGTFAVNADGSSPRQLISWSSSIGNRPGTGAIVSRILPYGWYFRSAYSDGSADVLVYRVVSDNVGDVKEIKLARLDSLTGELRSLSDGMPDGARTWKLDARQEPRMVTTSANGREKVYWRPSGTKEWTEVAEFDPLIDGFTPWLIGDGNDVLVETRSSRDVDGLYKFDPVAKRIDTEPLVSVQGYDLDPRPVTEWGTNRLLGIHFVTDAPGTYWFNADLRRIQQAVDAALPAGRTNRLYCGRCESARFFVVRSISDRQPGEYFLFDRSKSSLEKIGAARPWIVEATQGRRTLHRVTMRDGLSIPVYVTHPAGAASDQPLPTVVMVHGGPFVRGSTLPWNAEAQLYASRGYRVLQPEYRGSEGYGYKLFRAGWQQWGLGMQDDIAEAVAWAVQQKLVDASRVCIVGGSYGGYAALMGPIRHPGVYRCAATFAGVTDLDLMYGVSWSDYSAAYRQYGMPVLIGDRTKDAKSLAEQSPLKRVAELKVPVLLGHGGSDRRVPIEHERQFVSAARSAGVDIDVVVYNEEGHGFSKPENEADYYGRVDRFLAKHLQSKP